MTTDVAVVAVVVTHTGASDMLDACLAALADVGGIDHCVVVDNSGRPVDESAVSSLHRSMSIVREACANRGFGAAANVGFARGRRLVSDSERSVMVLLNDDVVVADGWLEPLLDEFDDDRVGAVQPMLVFAGTDTVNSLGVVIGSDGAGTDVGLGEPVDSVDRSPTTIELFTGGAVAFRPEFLVATGGFDERYFLYYEDVDLARRGAALGWSYRCVPASVVMHRKGASTEALGDRVVFLRERNRLWSAFRNESSRTIVGAVWLSGRRLRHRPYLVHLRALVAGVGEGAWRLVERARAGARRAG